MRSPEPQCLRLSGRKERRRSPSFLALVGPAVAVVAARSRVQPQNSTCPGGITCPGGCAGDQLGVSLGQPALDGDDQPGVNHATTLSAGCPRYLPDTFPWLRPSCVGQSASFCDSKNAAARHGAIDLFRL